MSGVLDCVRVAMGAPMGGKDGTCCCGVTGTLGGGLYGGSFGSTLGAGWGGTGGNGVCVSTLGDWRIGVGVGLGGVGRGIGLGGVCRVTGCGVAVPCPAQLWHESRNVVVTLSCASCMADGASVSAFVRV